MTPTKRKVSVSLDADLVAELERSPEPLSAQLNEALRRELERRRRDRVLRDYVGELEAETGTPDPALVQKYVDLLT